MTSSFTELTAKFDTIVETGKNLVSNVEGRLLWLELLKGLDAAMPKDTRPSEEKQETAEDVTARNELHITSLDCEYTAEPRLGTRASPRLLPRPRRRHSGKRLKSHLRLRNRERKVPQKGRRRRSSGRWRGSGRRTGSGHGPCLDPAAAADPNAMVDSNGMPIEGAEGAAVAGASGPGWIVQLKGYHFHNTYPGKPELDFTNNEGKEFIENTFFKSLEEGTVKLPDGPNGELVEVPIPKLGIQFPVVTTENPIVSVSYYPEATDGETGAKLMSRGPDIGMGVGGRGDEPALPNVEAAPLRLHNSVLLEANTPHCTAGTACRR